MIACFRHIKFLMHRCLLTMTIDDRLRNDEQEEKENKLSLFLGRVHL